MKRFSEWTIEELMEATDEQVETLIALELAEQGVEMVPPPTPLPKMEDVGIVPAIEGYGVGSLIFAKLEDAQAAAAAERFEEVYEYNGAGYDYKWLKADRNRQVEPRRYYRQEDVQRVSALLVKQNALRAQFEKEDAAYQKCVAATSNIRSAVWDAVMNARRLRDRVKWAEGLWAEHVRLAEGDLAVARRFFTAALKNEPTLCRIVLARVDTASAPATQATPTDEQPYPEGVSNGVDC